MQSILYELLRGFYNHSFFLGYEMLKTKISELKEIVLKREQKVFPFSYLWLYWCSSLFYIRFKTIFLIKYETKNVNFNDCILPTEFSAILFCPNVWYKGETEKQNVSITFDPLDRTN